MKIGKLLKTTVLLGASAALAITLINDKKRQEENEIKTNEEVKN